MFYKEGTDHWDQIIKLGAPYGQSSHFMCSMGGCTIYWEFNYSEHNDPHVDEPFTDATIYFVDLADEIVPIGLRWLKAQSISADDTVPAESGALTPCTSQEAIDIQTEA